MHGAEEIRDAAIRERDECQQRYERQCAGQMSLIAENQRLRVDRDEAYQMLNAARDVGRRLLRYLRLLVTGDSTTKILAIELILKHSPWLNEEEGHEENSGT